MKKILFTCLVTLSSIGAVGQPIPADTILEYVREKLPSDPLKLMGTLKVRTKKGFTKSSLPVVMELDWGAKEPNASYCIGDEMLAITWSNEVPCYVFSNPRNTPSSEILGTGLTWADLSFSVLWWSNSRLIAEEKKINRECYVVDVPVPDSGDTMRLWVEKKMGMLLEVQTLDANQKMIRRLKIKSIKKMDGMWVAKDLELLEKKTGNKTLLQITDLQWKDSKSSIVAFDPAESVNQLTFDLYDKLAFKGEGNLFLSPYSISSALAMVYGGARGETAVQMEHVLYFAGQGVLHPAFSGLREKLNAIEAKGQIQLSVANSLWPQVDYIFLPDYLALMKEFYDSEIQSVDYKTNTEGARQQINIWVEEKTNDRIKDLIPRGMLDSSVRLVLANAIYFKGNWASKFEADRTRLRRFKLADGTISEVPTMSQTAKFKIARAEGFQALELPYEGDDLSMIVLLPNSGSSLSKLGTNSLASLEFREKEVMVQLPKFKIESTFQLGDTLAAMGMPLVFSTQADLSGMDGSRNLHIGAVVHKAFVEVNEEGTEAAAATAIGVRTTSMPSMFIADHPFLFFIRENGSGAILFIGRVVDPSVFE